MKANFKGQIWVETVLYTLIALALIGITLAFVMPKINESKNNLIVEQTISSLSAFDQKINSVLIAPGNKRVVDWAIKKGDLIINATGDNVIFVLDGMEGTYSQPNVSIQIGRVSVLTIEGLKKSTVYLTLDYKNKVNLTYGGQDSYKVFTPSSLPYKFSITNFGRGDIDIEELSIG